MINIISDILYIVDEHAYFELDSHNNILTINDKRWNKTTVELTSDLSKLLMREFRFSNKGNYAFFNLKQLKIGIVGLRIDKLSKI